jgi:hypothetical protein
MMISTNAPRLLSNWRIIGLVSLLQRCRRARASAGTSAPTTCADSDADHAGFAVRATGGLHRGSFAWYPGRNLTRKLHEPCACSPLSGPTVRMYIRVDLPGVDPPGVTAPAVVVDWTVGCTVSGRSHGTAPAPGRNLTRKLHEPCVCSPLSGPTYGADVHSPRGGRPTWSDCAGRRCGLDGGLHRGSFAWYPGRNLTRKLHEPCVCSPLSGPTYGADVHSPRGGRPTWSDCAGRRCGLDGGLHRGSFAWYPGRNLTRKLHEPCVCSPLSGPTYGADVHSPRGGRPTWSDCAGRRCGLDGGLHRGSFAWYPGRNLTRKLHEPCACSPLSGPTYGADVHSPRGGRPTWSDCAGRRCGLDGGLHRGSFAWHPGPKL